MSDDAKVRRAWTSRRELDSFATVDGKAVLAVQRAPNDDACVLCIPLLPDGSFPPEVVERVAKAIGRAVASAPAHDPNDYSGAYSKMMRDLTATAALAALTERET